MSMRLAKPEHEVAYQDVCELLRKHAGKLTAAEVLAVAANLVGKLIAMQDQRAMSRIEAIELVRENIEFGNQTVIDQLDNPQGTA